MGLTFHAVHNTIALNINTGLTFHVRQEIRLLLLLLKELHCSIERQATNGLDVLQFNQYHS
jgi:hypothetical protein